MLGILVAVAGRTQSVLVTVSSIGRRTSLAVKHILKAPISAVGGSSRCQLEQVVLVLGLFGYCGVPNRLSVRTVQPGLPNVPLNGPGTVLSGLKGHA